jgi:hypothetical protein
MRQDAQLHELAKFWQRQIKELRNDCARYRVALRALETKLAGLKGQPDGK